jgi:hypothetical protein
MSGFRVMSKKPSSRDAGYFAPIDLVAFQTGVATYMTALREGVPPDPTFPDTAWDPVTRKVTPLQDNPFTRAAHAASKLFEDAAQRIGFMYRLQALMPIAFDRKYDQYRNDGAGTMHLALMTAIAYAPCSPRMTPKVLRASFDKAFREILPQVEAADLH